jgi:hypothetical protein
MPEARRSLAGTLPIPRSVLPCVHALRPPRSWEQKATISRVLETESHNRTDLWYGSHIRCRQSELFTTENGKKNPRTTHKTWIERMQVQLQLNPKTGGRGFGYGTGGIQVVSSEANPGMVHFWPGTEKS